MFSGLINLLIRDGREDLVIAIGTSLGSTGLFSTYWPYIFGAAVVMGVIIYRRLTRLPRLIKKFRHSKYDEYDRRRAVESLVKIGSPAVEPLVEALGHEYGGFRVPAKAAEVLGEIGDPRAVGPLINALRHFFHPVGSSAAWALGKIGDPRAVEPLIKAITDKNSFIDEAAAEALGKIGDKSSVPALRKLSNDGANAFIREKAERAIEKIEARNKAIG